MEDKNRFNDITIQTICEICGSKKIGQYVLGDNAIFLMCEICEDNGNRNGWNYKVICDIEEYKNRLEYLQIIDMDKFNSIEELYELKSPNEIHEFIESYPFLIQPLIDVHEQIHKIFKDQNRVCLDYYVDPDACPDSEGELCISIPCALNPGSTVDIDFKRLNELDGWFIGLPYKVRKILYTILLFED